MKFKVAVSVLHSPNKPASFPKAHYADIHSSSAEEISFSEDSSSMLRVTLGMLSFLAILVVSFNFLCCF